VADSNAPPLYIRGTEGTVVTFAKCCRPIPGDPILGFLSAGRGVVIHSHNCKNTSEFRKKPERWIDVQWEDAVQGNFPVDIRIDVANQRGVLATIAATIAETDANIDNVSLAERDGVHAAIFLTVAVRDRRHLARIMRSLRAVPEVVKIARVRG
jgi:(p)ppGpp synthase/HD superfamily hydrolase